VSEETEGAEFASTGELGRRVPHAAGIHFACLVLAPLFVPGATRADTFADYLDGWSDRAHQALNSEPHWNPPLNTITPRLTQVARYDQIWQSTGAPASIDAFDGGKGVEVIPFSTTSFTFNLPAYYERSKKGDASGWGDWPFVLMKQRLFSAAPQDGNYIVTGYLGAQAPVGSAAFTNHAWVITPGLGFGKGWEDFDLEGGITFALPAAHAAAIGTAITTNLMGQYHLSEYLWPEVELNDTAWSGGSRRGLNQLFMTAGSVFGNFPLIDNYSLGIGLGYQFALTRRDISAKVLNPVYDHNWVLSLRLVY
jgi:hypothetical protein